MKKAIIGKKVGMTQIFDEAGKVIPVTLVFCRRAASEGKISSAPVMRLQWERLKQKRKSSAVRGERQLPASSSANTSAKTASAAKLSFRSVMPPPPFKSVIFIIS